MKLNVEQIVHLNQFVARPYQLKLWHAFENLKYRKLIAIWPRRAGKDLFAFNCIILPEAIKNVGVYWYVWPTYAQGKKGFFDGITNDGKRVIDYIPQSLIAAINQHEQKIRLINGSIIQVIGASDADRIVGANPRGVCFSEYALYDNDRARQLILPILRNNKGWELYISTPRSKNHLWALWNIAQANKKEWYSELLTIDETKHISREEIRADIERGEISEDLAAQEYFCFPNKTPILMWNGLKDIEDIKINDLVISHAGRPRKVTNVMRREYQGDLVIIRSYGSAEELRVTPNHPIRVYNSSTQTFSWKAASDITKADYVVFPKMNIATKKPLLSYELAMLIAWYTTEGSTFKNGVQFTLGKQSEIDRVGFLLSTLGYRYSIVKDKKSAASAIVVCSTNLGDFLKTHTGTCAEDKRIDLTLINGYEEEFFDELMLGDGCYSKKGRKYSYTTISKALAYQVQLLANSLRRNYTAGISIREPYVGVIEGRQVQCSRSYQVNIYEMLPTTCRTRHSFLKRAKNCVAGYVKEVSREYFSGTVYNFSVQYDESYIAAGRAVHNCSFDLGIAGSVYGYYIDKMKSEGRIGAVPYEPGIPVYTSWDLGINDPTCIIFFQLAGQTIRIIDYYENNRQPIHHYVRYMNDKEYVYGKYHIAPHDIAVEEMTSGLTRRERFAQLGVEFLNPIFISLDDGIETVRATLPKIWIDETKCKPLIRALENYRYEWDERYNVYKRKPVHDSHSHAADALRYMCININQLSENVSAKELDQRYYEAMYGTRMPMVFDDTYNRWGR